MTILEEIVNYKKIQVAKDRDKKPVSTLEKSRLFSYYALSMTDYLQRPDKTGIIAEFKRRSPSKGVINSESSVEEVTTGYFRSGASGLSILTDEKYFGGNLADLKRARQLNPIPILRKDFIIDEYQVIEAKSNGADVILLIAAALDKITTKRLAGLARSLGMQVLLEVHEEIELNHLNEFVNIVGVNNRDLKSFQVNIERSVELSSGIPPEFVKISESGITSALIFRKLRSCGYQGFLIGEHFMRSPEPALAFSDFIELIYTP
jgi:indole-3-glycerol phosphate synthase